MPTYEYVCRACGEPMEAVQGFHDAPLVECPKCGGELRKVFGNVGIVLKGSGFYKTDSRTSSKPAAEKSPSADAKSDGASSSSESGTSDSASTKESPKTPEAKVPAATKSD